VSRLGELRLRLAVSYIRRFRSFDAADFAAALARLGIALGDSLMVHGSLKATSGYQGKPVELIKVLKDAVGPDGLLVMPSMTYTDSSRAFLLRCEAVDLRRSPSRMGLLSELFRRGQGVHRSASPTHPLLAWGGGAREFVTGHERTDRSFGPDSPFQRLLDRDAKVLCLDTSAETVTFMHFLEDRFAAGLDFALYEANPLPGRVIDATGLVLEVPTRVLSDASRVRRDEGPLWRQARKSGLIAWRRVGNAQLQLMRCRELESFVRGQPAATLGIFVAQG
jgi:aminoglycoside 3-N-acetyltransferase